MKKLPKCKLFLSILLLMPCYTYGALSTGDESKESTTADTDIQIKWFEIIQSLDHGDNRASEAIEMLKNHPNIDVSKPIGPPYLPHPQAPLQVAVNKCNFKFIQFLIEWGANVNPKETEPIMILALRNSSSKQDSARKIAREILVFGFLRKQGTYLPEPLCHLVYKYFNWDDQLEIISFLLASGANVNVLDSEGKHPLEYVDESECRKKIIKLIVEKNPKDDFGRTLLHFTVMNNMLKMTEELINAGQELCEKDNSRKTPLDCILYPQR